MSNKENVAADVQLGIGVVLDAPREARRRGEVSAQLRPTRIGKRTIVGNYAVLYEGSAIGEDCAIDDGCRFGYDSTLGDRSRLEYGAFVCDRVTVGSDCVIAGFVGDACVVGDRCIVMGQLVHELSHPRSAWGREEAAPSVQEGSVVGMGAVVVGGVRIGPRAYVAAGAVVTRDVPTESVVIGVNQVVGAAHWKGEKLDIGFFSP